MTALPGWTDHRCTWTLGCWRKIPGWIPTPNLRHVRNINLTFWLMFSCDIKIGKWYGKCWFVLTIVAKRMAKHTSVYGGHHSDNLLSHNELILLTQTIRYIMHTRSYKGNHEAWMLLVYQPRRAFLFCGKVIVWGLRFGTLWLDQTP